MAELPPSRRPPGAHPGGRINIFCRAFMSLRLVPAFMPQCHGDCQTATIRLDYMLICDGPFPTTRSTQCTASHSPPMLFNGLIGSHGPCAITLPPYLLQELS
ncbi:jg19085 [Pararge aegeria aegeria]|uniref:Jg19085 protein n=1 Tax=Pararge aegeria aegeria TaxID=348720 RepID=A0A8S4SLN1_9NEOP|nr:jg19085 [Pararge aegeria aegeria]